MFNSEANKRSPINAFKAKALSTAEALGACRRNFPRLINKSQEKHWNTAPTRIPRLPIMRKAFEAYRSAVEAACDKEFWSEKSPRNIFVIDQIQRYIPDALFLHIIRPGEDTIASLIDAGRKYSAFAGRFGGERGVERACDYWNKAISITQLHAGSTRHHVTLYNDLIENPEREIQRICTIAGLDFSAAMLQPNFDAVRETKESWKFTYGDTLSRAIRKYEKLTRVEQKAIDSNMKFSDKDLAAIRDLSRGDVTYASKEK